MSLGLAAPVLTVWTSTQELFFETLGAPKHRVRVIATPIVGGFGGKFVLLEPLRSPQ